MKKVIFKLKNNSLFTFILGIMLCSGIVYAASYYAIDISYINENSEVDNVNDALDELYEKANEQKITFVNNGASYTANGTSKTIDLSSYSNYQNLVLNENLFLVLANGAGIVSHYDHDRTSVTSNLGYKYDATTGILTYYVTLGGSLNMNYYNTISFKVLIIG